jgi:hypothetical protein
MLQIGTLRKKLEKCIVPVTLSGRQKQGYDRTVKK